ncbi:LysR substrate-binding domain-containing protein [Sphingomonas sp.]|uniref:LysR substrate-binding domain-containing protein n=1 Tax=Sphingomonas sp. TaxID=28214 RepID=UPI0031E0E3A1
MLPFDLNLRHLRGVAAIVREGTLSAAAARVALSQPALTQGIAKIEQALSTRLFERRATGLVATTAGAELARRTEAALAHLASAFGAAQGSPSGARVELRVTTSQLRAVLNVANAGSIAGAAASAGMSSPSVHRALREFERLVGAPVLERRGRLVGLTRRGTRIARAIRLAEREIAAALAELSTDPGTIGPILVGAMPLCRVRVLPKALAAFTRAIPGVRVEVIEGSWRELLPLLRDGVLDLMVGALRDPPPVDIDQRDLFTDRLAIIARAGHPLAGPDLPTVAELCDHPWIVGPPDSPLTAAWHTLFAAAPTRPHASIACGSALVARGVLLETDHLTLLSPAQVEQDLENGRLAMVGPLLDGTVRRIGVSTRGGWRITRQQRVLLDMLEAASGPDT